MKVFSALALALLVAASPALAQDKITDPNDRASYVIGLSIGNDFKAQDVQIKMDMFMRGMKDALEAKEPALSQEEISKVMTDFMTDLKTRQAEKTKKVADENKQKGEAFLAENAKKEGVKTLPSGLQYKVITSGKGKSPKLADSVTTNYKGSLLDGTEFDSSYKRGQPATFPVGGVIKGWTEALQLMKEGDKWEIFVPAALAYGEQGAGGVIGPNSVLVFEVELITVNEKK